jgi:hypothetical protein
MRAEAAAVIAWATYRSREDASHTDISRSTTP